MLTDPGSDATDNLAQHVANRGENGVHIAEAAPERIADSAQVQLLEHVEEALFDAFLNRLENVARSFVESAVLTLDVGRDSDIALAEPGRRFSHPFLDHATDGCHELVAR